jgi:hypothetical protein
MGVLRRLEMPCPRLEHKVGPHSIGPPSGQSGRQTVGTRPEHPIARRTSPSFVHEVIGAAAGRAVALKLSPIERDIAAVEKVALHEDALGRDL